VPRQKGGQHVRGRKGGCKTGQKGLKKLRRMAQKKAVSKAGQTSEGEPVRIGNGGKLDGRERCSKKKTSIKGTKGKGLRKMSSSHKRGFVSPYRTHG